MSDKPHIKLVQDVCDALCEQPDRVTIEDTIDERGVLIQCRVAQSDLPRMIGKGGETANSIRQLLRALGLKNNARYSFKVDAA